MLINAFFIVDGKNYDFERFWFGGTLLYAIFVLVAPECSCRASRDVRINYTADKHLLPLTLVCALVLPRSRFFLSQTKGNFRLVLIFCSVCVYHVVINVQYYKYSNSWVHSVSSRFWQNLKHHSFVLLVHRHETHKRTFSFK